MHLFFFFFFEEGNFLNHFFPFFQSDWSGIKKKSRITQREGIIVITVWEKEKNLKRTKSGQEKK